MIKVKFMKLKEDAFLFQYANQYSACMDIFAYEDFILEPYQTRLVQTGIAVELPECFEGIIRGRSGLALKGVQVHLGTIDEDYRGDISVIMYNTTNSPMKFNRKDRIAQFTIKPIYEVQVVPVNILSTTERNTNGFGSTGK